MSPAMFADLQEALLWFFGPVLTVGMWLMVAGGILSVIGVIVLELAARLTR